MSVILVAAIGRNNELGKDNKLIWKIPEDLQFFKKLTMGNYENNPKYKNRNTYVVMGRKTFESLPNDLKGRTMLVISSRNLDENYDVVAFHSIDEVLETFKDEDLYVIGGGSIYKQFMPYADIMYLTEIDAYYKADTYFPWIYEDEWEKETIKENTKYQDISYIRNKYVRKREKDER